jgi:(R,R)-butanediol dehydrogenase/meso-butanediol dehydrogenase/diacetyl reductase
MAETMKQVIYKAKGEVAVIDAPIPSPKYGEVKIKLAYCAICATDVHIVTMGLYGYPFGVPIGHEATGVIVELGPGTENSGFKVGDRVIPNALGTCGECDPCKRDMPAFCVNKGRLKCNTMSEYCVANIRQVFKIPDDGNMQWYSLAEPMVSAVRAMDLVGIKHGQTVAISGVGGIGTILLNLILLAGGASITAIDLVAGKRENALTIGAQHVIDPEKEDVISRTMEITGGRGFDFVFEASGAPPAAKPCIKMIANGGTIVFFAVYPMDFELPVNLYELYRKEGRIQTVFTDLHLFPRVIDLIPRMQFDKVIGKVMPLTAAVEAFELFQKSIYPKILLKCDE